MTEQDGGDRAPLERKGQGTFGVGTSPWSIICGKIQRDPSRADKKAVAEGADLSAVGNSTCA